MDDGGISTPLAEGNGAMGARSARLIPLARVSDKPAATTKVRRTLENDRFIQMSLNVFVLFIV
jgi:hypothetical protein